MVVFVLDDDHQTLFQALYVKKQAKMKFQVFFFFYQNHGFDKIQCGNFVNQYYFCSLEKLVFLLDEGQTIVLVQTLRKIEMFIVYEG